jgi:hypothetical protein
LCAAPRQVVDQHCSQSPTFGVIIMAKNEMQTEALERARASQALTNYPAIYAFMAKGIAEADIRPRENVFCESASNFDPLQ